jgi:rubrerythrin
MSQSFNIDEILQMATQIERNGGKFYRLAADMTADPEVEKTLTMLARMEDDHETTFEAMREKGEFDGFDLDLDAQAAAYLQAVADGYVFDVNEDVAEVLSGNPDAIRILRIAIGREKDAVTLFAGLREAMPAGWGHDRVDAIIREELSHIAILSDEIRKTKERK